MYDINTSLSEQHQFGRYSNFITEVLICVVLMIVVEFPNTVNYGTSTPEFMVGLYRQRTVLRLS